MNTRPRHLVTAAAPARTPSGAATCGSQRELWDALVHVLVAERAAAAPDAVAVAFGEERVSYGELDARANRLARHLIACGVRPESLVGVCLERSAELVVAVLAVLKAGAAFVPLDPEYPAERLGWMLEDCAASVVVTQRALAGALPEFEARLVLVDEDAAAIAGQPSGDPGVETGPDSLAYVMFTSGSTGRPKGVLVEHRSIVRLVCGADFAQLSADEVFLQLAPVSFDASTLEIWGALVHGARLVVFPPQPPTVGELRRVIAEHEVSVLWLTASLFNVVIDEDPSVLAPVEQLLIGGEALSVPHVRKALAALPETQIINGYGPTENTTFTCCHPIPRELGEVGSVPIGRPIANTEVLVVDEQLEPVGVGVPGELCTSGLGLARGYLQRPELTAERFVAHPFRAGERMYRTGDLVRWREDGTLEYLGRIDQQVKLRGFRIELGEIQAALTSHPAVGDAAVVVVGEGRDKRLVAYVVADGEQPSAGELRAHLEAALPAYMVPSAFVALDALPLNPNGKLDRDALPAPEGDAPAPAEYAAPRDGHEALLARTWGEVLGVERVGIHDNFFALGGDSIVAIQVVARLRRHGVTLSPKLIFEHQSIAALAAAAGPSTTQADQGPVVGEAPLTPIQRWFFEQDLPRRDHFNQAVLLALPADVDAAALGAAVDALVEHHDALRLRTNGERLRFETPGAAGGLEQLELPDQEDRAAAIEQLAQQVQAGLDLEHGPVARFARIGLDRLLLVVHHIAVDAVSWRILVDDLARGYEQAAAGRPVDLGDKTTSFKTWAELLQREAAGEPDAAEAEHWTTVPAAPLPLDHPAGRNTLASADAITVALDADETLALLREAPKAYRSRVDDLLLTALAQALTAWTGDDVASVAVESHGRHEDLFDGVDLSRTVGWFTTMHPVALPGPTDPGTAVKAVKERLRSVPRHGLGYGVLRHLCGDADLAARRPQISFNYLGQLGAGRGGPFAPTPEPTGLATSLEGRRGHVLEVTGGVVRDRLQMTWTYSGNLHDPDTIAALAASFKERLRAIVAHCTSPGAGALTPSDVPLAALDQTELDRLTQDAPVEDVYALSGLQQGLLFHTLLERESSMYFEQVRWRLAGPLDPDAFRDAWQRAADRHPVLRTAIAYGADGRPRQVVHERAPVPFEQHNLRALDPDVREARIGALLAADLDRGFELERPPLMRLTLLRTGDAEHELVWSFHHLLLDGWSVSTVLGEVLGFYGDPHFAPEPVRPYRDYVAWLAEQDLDAAERWWRGELGGFEAATPLAVDRPAAPGGDAEPGEWHGAVPRALAARLDELGRERRLTLNTVAQGAWALLLSRYSGEDDVVFGTTVAGRPPALDGVERMVGLFINTLPVRVRLDPAAASEGWLSDLQRRQAETRELEFTPLAQVQAWSDVPPGEPLFESLLVVENYPFATASAGGGIAVTPVGAREHTNYPMTVVLVPGDGLGLHLFYDRRRFEADVVERLAGHFVRLLEGLVEAPDAPVGELGLLSERERDALVRGVNETAAPVPDGVVQGWFAERVSERPDAAAVVFAGAELSYRALDRRAQAVAARLAERGVGRGHLVALCLERSPELVAAQLGVLKAGAGFVPVDPSYPEERRAFMLTDCGAAAVIDRTFFDGLPDAGFEAVPVGATDVAYVIYTSGSTGRPKGVVIEHGGLANLIAAARTDFALDTESRVLQFSSPSFDGSVWETFMALAWGGALCLSRRGGGFSVDELVAQIREERVSLVMMPPSALGVLPDEDLPSLQTVIAGGEKCLAELGERWSKDGRAFVNAYGPTEASVCVSIARFDGESDRATVPIGTPLANTQLYVLDAAMQLVPVGVPGELYVGGAGLARGYLNRPALTAERFVASPFDAGERLYRTGDLVRRLADGQLEFVGRVDHQVKLRGFRIELGEIEAALADQPGVGEAVAIVRDSRLVAYVGGDSLDEDAITQALKERLPAHMVPSALVVLDALPLTPNGKIDRAALPEPDRGPTEEHVAPGTATERVLAQVWSEVLGLDAVGVHDNFFALGGDSILSIQAVGRARELGVSVTPRLLFDHPTIAQLAELAGSVSIDAEQGRVTGTAPLTPIQHWLFEQHPDDQRHFGQAALLALAPGADDGALAAAVEALGEHHDALRLRATAEEQRFTDEVPRLERRADTDVDVALAEIEASLDVARGPVARFVRLGDDHLVAAVHHLAVDAVSWRILLDDLRRAYEQAHAGQPVDLGPKTTSLKAWAQRLAEYARGEELAREAERWLGAPEIAPLPLDHPSGENTVASGDTVVVTLDAETTSALTDQIPAAHRADVDAVLLTALADVVTGWTGETAVAVAIETHGREDLLDGVDLSRTVGWFTSLAPLVLHPDRSDGPVTSLTAIKEQVRAIPHRGIAYGLLRYLRDDADLAERLARRAPQMSFNYLGRVGGAASAGPFAPVGGSSPLAFAPATGTAGTATGRRAHVLEINAAVADGRLTVAWTYSRALHERATVEGLAARFEERLRELIAHCTGTAGRLTPSDVPLAGLSSRKLDKVLRRVKER
ncbi:MAG: hypothetical protein CSA58_12630 [Micrococcales bacterium]|nr:MAG: hypothetical protein CSA58_12630 [Micrococcales bacterium]